MRGRVTGLLLCVGTPLEHLADLAKQGAAALEVANDYTDVIEAARQGFTTCLLPPGKNPGGKKLGIKCVPLQNLEQAFEVALVR